MSRKKPTNTAASIRQKLLNLARDTGRPFGEVLQFYAMERFLYRVSVSEFKDKLILKGALMLIAWQAPSSRPTTDIDFLGKLSNEPKAVTEMIKTICTLIVEDDGLAFDADTVTSESITEDADYRGIRVLFNGILVTARITMQLDIGFGDVLIPAPEKIEFPTLLEMSKPVISGYSRESSVAEKLEAMVKLGIANSRMKDFYDIWFLSRWFDFDGAVLCDAVSATFIKRGTPLTKTPVVFTADFTENPQKQTQWFAFINRNRLLDAPPTIKEVVKEIQLLLEPVMNAAADRKSVQRTWSAKTKWDLPK